MSQGTNAILNPLERILSADLNLLQTMSAAWASNQERASLMSGLESFIDPGSATSIARQGMVAGFDPIVSAAPNALEVNAAGALWSRATAFPVIPPGDAGFSTPWRFAQQLEAVGTLSFPLPVTALATWYLLEGRVTNDAPTLAFRDIKNTISGLFVPTVVPVTATQSVEFNLVVGVAGVDQIPVQTDATWVPIAAVRSQPGGGVAVASEIYDVRRLPSDTVGFGRASDAFCRGRMDFTSDGGTGAGNRLIRASTVEPHKWFGVEMRASYNGVDAFTELAASGYVLTPLDELYIYAVAPKGIAPVNLGKPSQRGLFTLSPLPPASLMGSLGTASCWVSGAGAGFLHGTHFTLWTQGGGNSFGPGSAILCGLLRVNAAGDGFDPMVQVDGRVEMTLLSGFDQVTVDGAHAFVTNIPSIATSARCRASFSAPAIKTGAQLDGGALAGWYNVLSLVPAAFGASDSASFVTPPLFTSQNVTLNVTTFPAGANPFTVTVWCEGFDW